jgi:hypothetical protein
MKLVQPLDQQTRSSIFKSYEIIKVKEESLISQQVKLVIEQLLKKRSVFEMKNKKLRISENHILDYFKEVALKKNVILKSSVKAYQGQLAAAGFTIVKIFGQINYLCK